MPQPMQRLSPRRSSPAQSFSPRQRTSCPSSEHAQSLSRLPLALSSSPALSSCRAAPKRLRQISNLRKPRPRRIECASTGSWPTSAPEAPVGTPTGRRSSVREASRSMAINSRAAIAGISSALTWYWARKTATSAPSASTGTSIGVSRSCTADTTSRIS